MDWSRRIAFRLAAPQKRRRPVYESPGSIFDIRGGDRRLRVVLSAESESLSEPGKHELTLGLLDDDQIELLRYADEGPPTSLERVESGWGSDGVEGWVTVALTPERYMSSMGSCTSVLDGTIEGGGLGGADAVNLALGHDSRGGAPAPDFMATPFGRAAVALRAALGANADMLLTHRESLLPVHRYLQSAPLEVLRPVDALPLLGLYLRSRGRFVIEAGRDGNNTHVVEPPLFWRWAALSFMPSLEQRVAHLKADSKISVPEARGLHGIVARLALALESRDMVLCACLVPPQAKPAHAAAPSLDYLLLSLGAALDSLGKLVHHTLAVPGSDRFVSWTADHRGRKDDSSGSSWLRKLGAVEGGAAIREAAKTEQAVHFLRLFEQLRNSIHGDAPRSVPAIDDEHGWRPDRTLVQVTVRDVDRLLISRDRLGGHEIWHTWPVSPRDGTTAVVDPAVVGDLLIRHTTDFIDTVIDLLPPIGDGPVEGIVQAAVAKRIRWLLGLQAGSSHDPGATRWRTRAP